MALLSIVLTVAHLCPPLLGVRPLELDASCLQEELELCLEVAAAWGELMFRKRQRSTAAGARGTSSCRTRAYSLLGFPPCTVDPIARILIYSQKKRKQCGPLSILDVLNLQIESLMQSKSQEHPGVRSAARRYNPSQVLIWLLLQTGGSLLWVAILTISALLFGVHARATDVLELDVRDGAFGSWHVRTSPPLNASPEEQQ